MLNSKNHLKVWILSGLLFLGFPSKLWSQKNVIYSYFKERLHYTPEAKAAKTGGLILIQLKVNDKGELIRKDEIRTLGNGLNQQVNEIIRSVKNWNDFLSGWHGEIDLRIPMVYRLREREKNELDSTTLHLSISLKSETQEKTVYQFVEQEPEYPEGEEALLKFITEKIRYPKKAMREFIMGRVFVDFVVDSTGSVDQLRVVQGISPECDAEALRVMAQMKPWKPGKQNGKAVRTQYSIPIAYDLGNGLFNYRSSNLMLIDTIYCWNQDTLFAQFPGGRLGLKDSITNQLQETLITKTEFQTLSSEFTLSISKDGTPKVNTMHCSDPRWEDAIRSAILNQKNFKAATCKGIPIDSETRIHLEVKRASD